MDDAGAADDMGDLFADMEEEEEDMYGAASEFAQFGTPSGPVVFATSHLVGAPQGRIAINKDMAVVCTLVNDGDEVLNVTGMFGTLNDPVEGNVVMNFTGIPVNETIAGDSEVSYAYRFRMPPGTPAQSFQMMFHIFYTVGNGRNAAPITFYNQTVEMYESGEMDWESTSQATENIVFVFAVVGTAIALFMWSQDSGAAVSATASTGKASKSGSSSYKGRSKGKKKSHKHHS